MPELPEAETIVRTLAPHIAGQRITEVRFLARRVQPGTFPELAGKRVQAVHRYGKQVLLEFEDGFLAIQLRMTGLLLWNRAPGPHTRAVIAFPHGALSFDDIRQFGSIRWLAAAPRELGPDPLEISPHEFTHRLRSRQRQIKPLLLDQHFLRGLGNIYVDEILFAVRMHPLTLSSRIGKKRGERLHAAMQATLRKAIKCGGSSISDYLNADGHKGTFQLHHQVYGRAGKPCPSCGRPIRRILVAQRGTHYCPACQK